MKHLVQGIIALGLLGAPAIASADPGDIVGIEIASVDLNADMVGDNIFGYWEYLPTEYDTEGEPWPMFIFLSGTGENGNGLLPPGGCSGPAHPGSYLCRNLRHGPQSHIWNHLYGNGTLSPWDEDERPFIVISPQNPLPNGTATNPTGPYEADEVNEFLDFLLEAYNVDPRRIYLTGMSMGGYSVNLNAVEYSGRFAALAPLPGIGPGGMADPCGIGRSAMWAFHGDNDQAGQGAFDANQVTFWLSLVDACPEPHPDVRLTMYVNAGHNVWSRTIDPSQGQDDPVYDQFPYAGNQMFDTVPYQPDLYTWLLQHDLPEVDAGEDFEVTTNETSFEITADILDEDPVEFTWTQTGGDPLTLTGTDAQTLSVSDLVEGTYTFHVFALDADDQWDEDDITVTVVMGVQPGETDTDTDAGSEGGEGTDGVDTSDSNESGDSEDTNDGESSSASDSASSSDGAEGGSESDSNGGSDGNSGGNSDGNGTADSSDGNESSEGGDSDTDSGESAGADEGGGCSSTGQSPPSAWMLGLFGLAALRRRRG